MTEIAELLQHQPLPGGVLLICYLLLAEGLLAPCQGRRRIKFRA